jgi:proline racemase
VALAGVPSFVNSAGVPLCIGSRHITVDIAFGGECYAIADSEAIGIPIDIANASALIRMGREITAAVDQDIDGTIFTGSPPAAADLRSATVIDGEVLRRSPGVTGTAALMAVLNAMGLLTGGHRFMHEGIRGTTLCGTITGQQQIGEVDAIIPAIEASASITGFHEFVGD